MAGLTVAQRRFLETYERSYESKQKVAGLLERFAIETLSGESVDLHLATARAKTVDSIRLKLLKKGYPNPETQITDQVGLRLITYYGFRVDALVDIMRRTMHVDEANSLDKRSGLIEGKTFGYRSVHLVGVVKPSVLRDSQWSEMKGQTFEVQIRSLLDHTWAEIEHEVVYKSGVQFEGPFTRRFAAAAGALEILEREFVQLRGEFDVLVDSHIADYQIRKGLSIELDAARLVGFLELLRPDAIGWRGLQRSGRSQPVSAAACVRALAAVGVGTASKLEKTLALARLNNRIDDYAAASGRSGSEVPHPVLVALIIGHKDWQVLVDHMPQLARARDVKSVLGR